MDLETGRNSVEQSISGSDDERELQFWNDDLGITPDLLRQIARQANETVAARNLGMGD